MSQPQYTQHARERMVERGISEHEIAAVLEDFHTFYHDRNGNDIFVGHPFGRRIKVVVAKGSDPPLVITTGD